MRFRRFPTSLVAAMLLGLSTPASAGQLYDMGPLLDAPHPFEAPAAPQPRRPSPPGYTGRLYDMGPMLNEPHPFDVPAGRPQYLPPPPSDAAAPPTEPVRP
jgi:hypothetical protein